MSKTYRLGIIGHPLGHTLSPVMHQAAARELGLSLTYDPFDVAPENLPKYMEDLRHGELDGLNVTVPHKMAVMEHMDEVSEEAQRIGAVNTIVISAGRLAGHNTDAYGFITSVTQNGGIDPANKKSLVMGAGGASRAVVWAMLKAGAYVTIANRTQEKAAKIANDFGGVGAPVEVVEFGAGELAHIAGNADIIVNASSVGMKGAGPGSLPDLQGYLRKGQLVVDIVYRPLNTPLLEMARLAGAATLDGLWMLIHQGAGSFEMWTGRQFPTATARAILEKTL
ncbi:MAG: shikimate dehydrogenase [Nitrospinota bacterium]|nr:shikimate dehydrogenase [Nitrospinota bacterium]